MNPLLFIIIMILIIIQIWLWMDSNKNHRGIALVISAGENPKIHGYLHFDDRPAGLMSSGYMRIFGDLYNLPPGEHGMHIHEKGDPQKCCNADLMKLGEHYNPLNRDHAGLIGCNRHLGDLGNINVDEQGKTYIDITAPHISINGKYSVLGRSIVIHQNKDDLGLGGDYLSKKNGNSGARIAYGIIGLE